MEYRVRYHITCVRAQRALASPLNTLTTREARAPISHAATRTRGTAARPDPRGAGGVTGHTARLDRGPPAFGLLEYGYTRFTELYTRATRWIQDERRSRHLLDTNSRDTRHETLVAPVAVPCDAPWTVYCTTAALCTCGTAHGPHKRHSMTRLYDVFAVTTVTVTDLTNKRTWIGRAVRRFLFMPCRAQCCQIAPSFRNAACTHGRA